MGTSNIRGEFNGLNSLIIKENPSVLFIFIASFIGSVNIVAVTQVHTHITLLFNLVVKITNIVSGSYKRQDTLRGKRLKELLRNLDVINSRVLGV